MVKRKNDYLTIVAPEVQAAADAQVIEDGKPHVGATPGPEETGKPFRTPTRGRRAVIDGPLEAIACHGCGVRVGYSTGTHYRVFHAPWCAKYPAVDPETEPRDHRIEFLVRRGKATKAVAESFGLTRQRVQQILAAR